ncbi:MAG: heparinase II/III family protein [Chitinophagaceae bacterium]|nr:heparinase II/III family protein [Chitinophagaceae bacterium]
MNHFILSTAVLFFSFVARAYEPRNLLQKQANLQQVKELLVSKSDWIKYPDYADREGWNNFTGPLKKGITEAGEAYLTYTWKVVLATDYLEYERSGSRTAMENPFGSNNKALSHLVFAELAEGKGRFLNQIINGVWHSCDMSSWVLSAHLPLQKSKRTLPDYKEQVIDLTSGDMGSFFSWVYYFFHDEFDKINPVIAERLKLNIQQRILQPYMERSDYWWQALSKPGVLVNNWNPWCNFNVLTCFLLLEDDNDKLAAAVYKTMQSTDEFLNYVKEDGACEEGPSYWGHAAGKLYDYLQILSYATNRKLSLFNEPMIKNMGEYIARSYVGNDWVVNFADASAKGGGDAGIIFRYGRAVKSNDMQQFAAYLTKKAKGKTDINDVRDFFRTLENINSYKDLLNTEPALTSYSFTWYPQTEFCYMKNREGFYFAAKAGFNNESHNHNDVGTFSLYIDTLPVFIDAGVGTYTRQTFSSERYTIWTMQSNYHNLPLINGYPQQFGAEFKATDIKFDEKKNMFSLNMADAYNKEASVEKWIRSYMLKEASLIIDDAFTVTALKANNVINFLTWAEPDITKAGTVRLKKNGTTVQLQYDTKAFDITTEAVPQTDKRLSNVWGEKLYRFSLIAKKLQ